MGRNDHLWLGLVHYSRVNGPDGRHSVRIARAVVGRKLFCVGVAPSGSGESFWNYSKERQGCEEERILTLCPSVVT